MLTVPQTQVLSDLQSTSEKHMKYQLELKRLEFEERQIQAEERRVQLEMEKVKMESEERKAKAQMKFDLRALEINTRAQPPPDSQSTFRVETAAKLLPKLGSEQELEVYLITFRKIVSLNNWPKEHWSAILQTQLLVFCAASF